MSLISEEDENFLKEFLKEFYRQIIKIENYTNFEYILTEWIEEFFDHNEKDSENILRLMKDHKEKENWISGIIGFFYENGLGFSCTYDIIDIDKNEILKFYLSSINNNDNYENKELFSM